MLEVEDMEESRWRTSVEDVADSRPTRKALAAGLILSAGVLDGGSDPPYKKPSKTTCLNSLLALLHILRRCTQ